MVIAVLVPGKRMGVRGYPTKKVSSLLSARPHCKGGVFVSNGVRRKLFSEKAKARNPFVCEGFGLVTCFLGTRM